MGDLQGAAGEARGEHTQERYRGGLEYRGATGVIGQAITAGEICTLPGHLKEDAARDRGEHDVRRLQHRDDVQRVVLAEGGVEPVQPEANGHRRV